MREIKNLPAYEILPYLVENNKILQDNTQNKYYVYRNSLYNKETKKPVTNTCLLGLVNQTDTSCRYTKTLLTTQINYVEPIITVTWKLSKTILNRNCNKNEIVIEGNNCEELNNSPQVETAADGRPLARYAANSRSNGAARRAREFGDQ